jgi:hypothetical protein
MPIDSKISHERRAEPRVAATGQIRLRSADHPGIDLQGVLLDLSAHGFRAVHNCPRLVTGNIVFFERFGATGRARVIWTQIDGDQVQSGFYALP